MELSYHHDINKLDNRPCIQDHYCKACKEKTKRIIDGSDSSVIYIDHYCPSCGTYIRYMASKMQDGSYISRPKNTCSNIVILEK